MYGISFETSTSRCALYMARGLHASGASGARWQDRKSGLRNLHDFHSMHASIGELSRSTSPGSRKRGHRSRSVGVMDPSMMCGTGGCKTALSVRKCCRDLRMTMRTTKKSGSVKPKPLTEENAFILYHKMSRKKRGGKRWQAFLRPCYRSR